MQVSLVFIGLSMVCLLCALRSITLVENEDIDNWLPGSQKGHRKITRPTSVLVWIIAGLFFMLIGSYLVLISII